MPKRSRPVHRSRRSRRTVLSIRTRLLLCALLPLGLATLALLVSHQWPGPAGSPLAGALLLGALGLALALVQSHGRALTEPLLQAQQALDALQRGDYDHPVQVLRLDESGEVLRLTALDPGAPADIPAWCSMTGHRLLHIDPVAQLYFIQRS